jgi:hypothetical protein
MWITRYFSLEELSYSKPAAVKDSRGSTTAIVAW